MFSLEFSVINYYKKYSESLCNTFTRLLLKKAKVYNCLPWSKNSNFNQSDLHFRYWQLQVSVNSEQ